MVNSYEIWIGNYFHMSGGIRALHVLRDELLARGLPAWMMYQGRRDPDCIGVYPEIVSGNPENYSRVARWLLNTAELPDDGPIFAWETGMGEYPLLTVNILEPDLWTPYTGPRSGVGYWVGKGVKDDSVLPTNAIEISRQNYLTRPELAERIRTLEYLISFDPFTAVNVEAVCSGTPVLIRGEHRSMTRQQIISHGWTPFGIAWDIEELPEAKAEVHLAYDHYQSLLPVFAQRVDKFVEITQAL